MRTVDPEKWSKGLIKPKSIFQSFSYKRKPRGLESLLRDSFVDSMKEFWVNSSISGHKYFREADSNKLTRKIHIATVVALLACAVAATAILWMEAFETPSFATSPLSSQRSLQLTNFPAVAFCSNNIISRTALHEYSTYLNIKDGNRTYSLTGIKHNLLHFGALIVMSRTKVDVRFTRFLSEVGGDSNITDIMLKLSPNCMKMLVRCTWLGNIVPCDQLFAVRLIPQGFCCAFNSRHELEDSKAAAKKATLGEPDSGLGMVIRENSDDFDFQRRPGEGFEVLIWEGSEYPMPHAGVVRVLPAHRNSSVFISLKAHKQSANRSLTYYSKYWRTSCMPVPDHGVVRRWSYSWCLAECREMALLSLCSCASHTMRPLHLVHGREPHFFCSLDHLNCLNKHRETFLYFMSNGDASIDMEDEYENALNCPQCLPDCIATRYYPKLYQVPHQYTKKRFMNKLSKEIELTNTTIVQVFFSTNDQTEHLYETAIRWHEIIARISNYWVCIVGAAIFITFELTFHCTVRWNRNYTRRRDTLAAQQRLWASLGACPSQLTRLTLDECPQSEFDF